MYKLLFLFLFSSSVVFSQTITTNFQNTSVCFGDAVSVPFTATGFAGGTMYKVQLLDKDGGTVIYDEVATGTGSPLSFNADNIRTGSYTVKVITNNGLTVSSVPSSGLLIVGPYAKLSNSTGNNTTVTAALGDTVTLKVNLYGSAPWVLTYSDGTFQHSIKTSANPYFLKVVPKQNTRYSLVKVTNSCGTNANLDENVPILVNSSSSISLANPLSLNICGGGSIKIPLSYTGTWAKDVSFRVLLTDTSGLYIPNSEQVFNYKADTVSYLLPNNLTQGKEYKIRLVVTKPYLLKNYLNSTYKLTATGNNCTPQATLLATEPSCGGTVLQAYPRGTGYQYQWFKNNTLISGETKQYLFAKDSASYHVRVYKTGYNSLSSKIEVWINATEVSLESPNPFVCEPGQQVQIQAFPNTPGHTYFWFVDSTINGMTSKVLLEQYSSASISTNQPKQYEVTIQKDGCERTVGLPVADKHSSGGYVMVEGPDNRDYKMMAGYDKIESIQKNINPAETYYFANKSIELLPGFESEKSTVFRAEIKGCSLEEETVFKNNVIFAENPINSKFISQTANTIVFQSSTETNAINVGDVLYSLPFNGNPVGYALKILGKSTSGSQITFTTRQAAFDEVFDSFVGKQDYGMNLVQNPPTFYDPNPPTNDNARMASTNGTILGDILTFGDNRFKMIDIADNIAEFNFVIADLDEDFDTEYDQIVLGFEFDYSKAQNYFIWNAGVFQMTGFQNYKLRTTLTYDPLGSNLTFEEQQAFLDNFKHKLIGRKIKLATFPLTPLTPSNILILPEIQIFLNFELGISGKLEAWASVENIGFNYTVKNFTSNGEFEKGNWTFEANAFKNPKFTAGITAEVELKAKAGIGAGLVFSFPVFHYESGNESYFGVFADINCNFEAKIEDIGISSEEGLQCGNYSVRSFFDWGVYIDGKFGFLNTQVASVNQYLFGPYEFLENTIAEGRLINCNEIINTDPLVAHYPLDNNFNDVSTYANNLNAHGSPVFTTDRNGNANNALLLDGTDDYLTVGNVDIPKGPRDRTITLWFKTDQTNFIGSGSEKMGTLLDYGTFDTNKRFAIQMGGDNSSTGNGKISFNSLGYSLNSRNSFADGKWHFLQLVYTGNYLNMYIDGKLEKAGQTFLNTTYIELSIGRTITNSLGLTQYFKGSIDDIKIYNKALSSVEIEELFEEEAPPAPNITSGLVAHYKFEGNFLDETENNNHGTPNGGVTFETDRHGTGQVAKFDGASWVSIQNSNTLSSVYDNLTISTWFNKNRDTDMAILCKSPSGSPIQFRLYYSSGSWSFIAQGLHFSFNQSVENNKWINVILKKEGSISKLFINGVLIQSKGSDLSYTYLNNTNLELGRDLHGATEYYNGLLDDIRIYNRPLTDEEVALLYESEKVQEPINIENGLVAYYPFNGNANDASGNNNHGTVHGATLTTDRYGNAGKAYSFDGVDDYIEISSLQSMGLGNNFSVSAWIKVNSYLNNQYPHIIVGQNNFISFSVLGTAYTLEDRGKVSFYFDPRTSTISQHTKSMDKILENIYYHVVATRKGEVVKLYINGNFEHSITNTSNMINGSFVSIGGTPVVNSSFLDGTVDDIRFYNRTLSTSEVQALYNQEKP